MRVLMTVLKGVGLLFAAGLTFLLAREFIYNAFPSQGYIDTYFVDCPTMNPEERQNRTERLFTKLARADSRAEGEVQAATMTRFAELFHRTQDESLLIGLDRVELDAHFHCLVCGLYRELSKEPGFTKRYHPGSPTARRIWECAGEFPDDEIVRLVGPAPDPSAPQDRRGAPQ